MAFLDDIAARLVSQGVGLLNTSLFLGSAAVIPTGAGPYMTVSETGGVAPTRIQNKGAASTQRPTAQVLVRASSYQAARNKALSAYTALDGLFNVTLGSTFYLKVIARQEPTDMGMDGAGRPQVVFNIEVEKQPS